MRAALYARFSTEKQSESSIEDQFRVCARIAEREGFEIVERYSDSAISGGTTQRPGYQRMLKAARNRQFVVIVAEDSSRLWRELSEQWRALKELSDLGVHVVGHGLDTRREEAKILLAVSGATSEMYRDEISRRTRRGLEGRAIAGQPTGGKAFGYIAARDGTSGQVEVHHDQAEIVRRIFTMYADGMSPRSIASTLNDEGIPSPGSTWNRTDRRKSGWLASAIHGDVTRGTGILNNRRYVGVLIWGRTQWSRGAADSAKRRMSMNGKPLHEARDERLRVVPQALWDRVKARQAIQSATVGARVKNAVRRNAPGQGRPARYLLSGLLRCGICDARFTLSDSRAYACASYVNGAACTNRLRVSRTLVESRILESVKSDLRNPELVAEVERRFRKALAARKPPADAGRRVAVLQQEIENLATAIAGGLLKSSPALARRLASAEAELATLQEKRPQKADVLTLVPRIAARYLEIVTCLEGALGRNPERARAALTDVIGPRITLQPDPSGKHLWADFGLEAGPLLVAAGMPEIMVAGAGFEPATFGL
jgi:site-specific DNA recombinase